MELLGTRRDYRCAERSRDQALAENGLSSIVVAMVGRANRVGLCACGRVGKGREQECNANCEWPVDLVS